MVDLRFEHNQSTLSDGAVVVVTKIHGAVDATTVRHFEEEIKGFLDQNCKHLVLDFGDLKYINSTGMGMMVNLTDQFTDMQGSIQLCNIPKKIGDLFDMLGLLSIFTVYDKAEDAIANLGTSPGGPAGHSDTAELVLGEEIPSSEDGVMELEVLEDGWEDMVAPVDPSSEGFGSIEPIEPEIIETSEMTMELEVASFQEAKVSSTPPSNAGPESSDLADFDVNAVEEIELNFEECGTGTMELEMIEPIGDPDSIPPAEVLETIEHLEPAPMLETVEDLDVAEALEATLDDEFLEAEGLETAEAEVFEFEVEAFDSEEDDAVEEAAVTVTEGNGEFPFDRECGFCEGMIEIPEPAGYQCPRCGNLFRVDSNGGVEDFHHQRPNVIEMSIPCDREFLRTFESLVDSLAVRLGVQEAARTGLRTSIERICDQAAQSGSDAFQAIVVGSKRQFAIGIRTTRPLFSDENGTAVESQYQALAEGLDSLERVALTSKGELLKLQKQF